jgi:hypothetical protein
MRTRTRMRCGGALRRGGARRRTAYADARSKPSTTSTGLPCASGTVSSSMLAPIGEITAPTPSLFGPRRRRGSWS